MRPRPARAGGQLARRTLLASLLSTAWLPGSETAIERRIFDAVNGRRREHRMRPLIRNERMAAEARRHSASMRDWDYFSHEDPRLGGPGQRLRRAGVRWRMVAENIYRERGKRDAAEAAVQGWMRSAGHRANILEPAFTETGVGVAVSGDDTYTVTQMFAQP